MEEGTEEEVVEDRSSSGNKERQNQEKGTPLVQEEVDEVNSSKEVNVNRGGGTSDKDEEKLNEESDEDKTVIESNNESINVDKDEDVSSTGKRGGQDNKKEEEGDKDEKGSSGGPSGTRFGGFEGNSAEDEEVVGQAAAVRSSVEGSSTTVESESHSLEAGMEFVGTPAAEVSSIEDFKLVVQAVSEETSNARIVSGMLLAVVSIFASAAAVASSF